MLMDEAVDERMVLNIGGTRFETYRSTLQLWPSTKLARLNKKSPFYRGDRDDYFFDRDPSVFRHILNFYRTDNLHFPHHYCDSIVRRELHYWGIDEEKVAPCCWGYVSSHCENRATDDLLCEALELDAIYALSLTKNMWQRALATWWTFLQDPSSSDAAMYYSYWIDLALFLSVLTIIFGNWDPLRVPSKIPRLHFNVTNNPKLMRFETTDPHPALVVLDVVLTSFFAAEFTIKFFVCPNIRILFSDSLNIVDIFAVFPKVVALTLRYAIPDIASYRKLYLTYYFLSMFDVFRVIRLISFGKHYVGLRILIVTLEASATDMFFLVFLIFVTAVAFGVAMYYCEISSTHTMGDMYTGTYWAFNTMTTVGYGDVVPVTLYGRCLSVMCSITGALLTGLAVPIIANNFNRYYMQARLMLMRQELGCPRDYMSVDDRH